MSVRRLLRTIQRRAWPAPRARPRPLILMYHRIAAPPLDPWGLSVHPDHFEAHVAVLRKHRTPMTMSEFVHDLDRGTLARDAVAVTFDDGYVDNLREAKPRLAAAGVPATLFLIAGAIGQRTEFWWDEIARAILGRPGVDASGWRAWQEPRTDHEIAYLALWRRLRDATPIERETALTRLRDEMKLPPPSAGDLPVSEREVAELSSDGLFEIGGHTLTHPALPLLDAAGRRREILEGKKVCERLVSQSIAGFAYPHGAVDADTRAAVEECGFSWACSTESCAVPTTGFSRYALPRVFVSDCDGPAFARTLEHASRIEVAS